MDKQKEALVRIVDSLQRKYDETSSFQSELVSDMQSLKEAYETSKADLNMEFDKLFEVLNTKKENLKQTIEHELLEKQELLKTQLKGYEEARNDASELINLARKATEVTDPSEFNQAAVSIKSRVTMSSIFRLSPVPSVTDLQCRMVADFKREQILLHKLEFLPVPETPIMTEENCTIANNCVTCEWMMRSDHEGRGPGATDCPSPIESFLFQYRQVLTDQASQDVPWKTKENIIKMKHVISDLKYTEPLLQVRVQAWNRAVGGEFSKTVTLPTPAFNFALDSEAAHANLKVTGPHTVEWDPSVTKPIEARVRSAGSSRTSLSPNKSPKKIKHKDRFIGESYTILGDSSFIEDESYFEVTPHKDCKTFAVGITSNTLSRYEQLGRTATSWCLFVSRWIQNSFTAKHNNKMKHLDTSSVPTRIGIYYNSEQSFLAFYDVSTHECLHLFKQAKCSSPLLPGFSVWCGSMDIHTGLQVPLWVDSQQLSSPKAKSPSTAPSEASYVCTVDLANQSAST